MELQVPGKQTEADDLKRREYKDANGQIHHHTRPSMERYEGADAGRATAPARRTAKRSTDDGGSQAQNSGKSARADGAGRGSRAKHAAQTTINHDEIRSWAERHGGRPAAVARTHSDGDVGIIRVMFPDAPNSEHGALVEISWDEFFEEFETRKLALLYEPDGMFSKIIGRDTAEKRAQGDHDAAR